MNKFQIRRSIQYAIDSRDIKKCEKNFEIIFGYEYNESIFTNKNFIEELIRFIQRISNSNLYFLYLQIQLFKILLKYI